MWLNPTARLCVRALAGTGPSRHRRTATGGTVLPLLRGGVVGAVLAQVLAQRLDGREAEDVGERQVALQGFAQAAVRLHGQQRVPAEVEEVVLHSDLRQLEHIAPDGGNAL